MTKKSNALDMATILAKPHFQSTADSGVLPPDPTVPVRMKVTLDQLTVYAGNPRMSENPMYEEIKESIRNSGLDHAPNITRESPDQPYMIKDGGNTRLKILNELWLETNDRKFYELDCMFYPWTSDLDVLIGHMKENEMRGDTLFIERAIAAVKIKVQLELDEQKPLSVRELSKRITERGWTVANTHLSYLIYAHETLFPIIPAPFWAGAGRPVVMAIRKMLDSARTFWESVATPEEGQGNFDQVWHSVFATLDNEDFNVEDAQNLLEADIAQRLGCPMMSVRGEVQAIAQGISKGGFRPTDVLAAQQPEAPTERPQVEPQKPALRPAPPSPQQPVSNHPSPESLSATEQPESSVQFESDGQIDVRHHNLHQVVDVPLHKYPALAADAALMNLPTGELMEKAFFLAYEYAAYFGFEDCVRVPNDQGVVGILGGYHSGFVLTAPTPGIDSRAFGADSRVITNYLYLFQLSNWCWQDDDNPDLFLVSPQNLETWLAPGDINTGIEKIMHMRMRAAFEHAQGRETANAMAFGTMNELELIVSILLCRCDEGVPYEF